MAEMLKHVGVINNTNKRCAVVYLQLPGDPDSSLVVDTDSLPDRFHQPLMEIIQSSEGQNSQELYEILNRRLMPDTGQTMLQTLHDFQHLEKVAVDNVSLTPRPNVAHPLRAILEAMGKTSEMAEAAPVENNFFQDQQNASTDEEKQGLAASYIQQAELMEIDAKAIREKAYQLVPELRPTEAVETPAESAEPAAPKKRGRKPKAKAE